MSKLLFSIVDTTTHPNFSDLYKRLGYQELRLDSQRKAISALKKSPPQMVVAEFVYTFSTYYQAINISNLDVFLHSLVKYAPAAEVIVLVNKADRDHVEKLQVIHPLRAVLVQPVTEAQMAEALTFSG